MRTLNNKHPHNHLLVEYAEGLIDTTARLNPEVASHVSQCDHCSEVVADMRQSFRVIDEVEIIEPCGDLAASILLAAKATPVRSGQGRMNRVFVGKMALAAALLLVIGGGLRMQSEPKSIHVESTYAVETPIVQADVIPVAGVWSDQIEAILSDAVMGSHRTPSNDWERAQHRAVDAYDDDIAEAELALANNPGFVRANFVAMSNREQKTRTLRNVYIESH